MSEPEPTPAWKAIYAAQSRLPLFRLGAAQLGADRSIEFSAGPDHRRLVDIGLGNNPREVAFLCLIFTLCTSWWLAELLVGIDHPLRALLILPLVLLVLPWLLQLMLVLVIYLPLRLINTWAGWRLPDNTLVTMGTLGLLTLGAVLRLGLPGAGRWLAVFWVGFAGLNVLLALVQFRRPITERGSR